MRTNSYILTVKGTGYFPIDMLRYACAWPMTAIDGQLIEATFTDPSYRKITEIRVTFTSNAAHADNVNRRLNSFGWHGTLEEML